MIFNNGGYKIQLLNIEYGIQDNYINISEYVLKNFIKNNVVHIPKNIDLNKLFGDPITFVEKHIKIRLLINNCEHTFYKNERYNHLLDDLYLDFNNLSTIHEIINNNYTNQCIYGVYYICCFGDFYLSIIEEQLSILVTSGLYNKTKKIFIFISLYNNENHRLNNLLKKFDVNNKFELITSPLNLYEKFAINNYRNYINKNNNNSSEYYIYYFHTKAITRPMNSEYHNRRKNLNYYILKKHELCLKLLNKYDVIGCTLYRYPKIHFSGNFWWSKSTHIQRLKKTVSDNYLACEMYICSYVNGKYISLSNTTNNTHDKNRLEENIFSNDELILKNASENILYNDWGKDFPSHFYE
jgi:hypothetical protein